MNKLKQNYRDALEKALRAHDPSVDGVVEKVIQALHSSNERMIASKQSTLSPGKIEQIRAIFTLACDEFRSAHNVKSTTFKETFEKSIKSFEATSSLLKGLIIGVAVTIGIVVILNETSLINISLKGNIKAQTELYNNYTNERNLVRIANEYLLTATDKIKEMQAANPDELTKIAGKNFVSVAKIDEALFKARPRQLAGTENIVIKANKNAYKILMNSSLCSVVSIDHPEMVDPKRKRKNRTCMHFGYWNEAGKKL